MFSNLFSLFNFRDAGSYLPDLLRGALISVELTFWVMALSLVFGLVVALARLSRFKSFRWPRRSTSRSSAEPRACCSSSTFISCCPRSASASSRSRPAFIGLTVNYSAYLAEVYRAGIEAVPNGQVEASRRSACRV